MHKTRRLLSSWTHNSSGHSVLEFDLNVRAAQAVCEVCKSTFSPVLLLTKGCFRIFSVFSLSGSNPGAFPLYVVHLCTWKHSNHAWGVEHNNVVQLLRENNSARHWPECRKRTKHATYFGLHALFFCRCHLLNCSSTCKLSQRTKLELCWNVMFYGLDIWTN